MKDPRRLLEGDASELERRLLRAASAEEAPEAARERLALRLGIAGVSLPAPQPSHPAASASAAPLAAQAAPVGTLSLGAGKLVLAGLALTTAAALGVRWMSGESAHGPQQGPQAAATVPAKAARAPEPALAQRSTPEQAPTLSPLAREIAALDLVRTLLRSGRAGDALTALNDYERARAEPVLSQEADALHIEALLATQQHAAAAKLAARFAQTYPRSPHLARVRALLAAARAAH